MLGLSHLEKQPNLFFIGAMRSGSTTVHLLLDQHSQIKMSTAKEPMFYVAEEMRRRYQKENGGDVELFAQLTEYVERGKYREQDSYQGLFEGFSEIETQYLGESSHYLYAPQVAKTIYSDCPHARILISLRNPVKRLFSEYLYYLRIGKISCSFADFVQQDCLFDIQRELLSIDPNSRIYKGFYARLIKPWLDVFGPEQVKVILFETMIKSPVQTVQLIYKWLELDAEFAPTPIHTQQGGEFRLRRLLTLFNTVACPIKSGVKKMLPRIARERLRSHLYSLFLQKNEMDPETAFLLKKIYRTEIEKLELLLDIEISEWK